ncbi:MAG: hypothetical protein RSC08_02975 [Oscillospiraceae bacterium]
MRLLLARLSTKDSCTALLFLAALALCVLAMLVSFFPKGAGMNGMRAVPISVTTKLLRHNPHAGQLHATGRVLPQKAVPLLDQAKALIAGAETALSHRLDESHFFIQLYGGVQRLTTRRVVTDIADPTYTVYKMEEGSLTFTKDKMDWDTAGNAHNLSRLQTVLKQRGSELLYIQAPQKIQGDGTGQLPYGVFDNGNQCADQLLAALKELDIPTMDLRLAFEADGKPWEDYFFKTDHHWKPEAAFFAYDRLCSAIETYSFQTPLPDGGTRYRNYQVPDYLRNPDSFSKTTYYDYFLGSQGKRTGTLYSGTDDIDVWKPNFMTRFRYQSSGGGFDRVGSFEDTLLFEDQIAQRDLFNGNPYTLYSGGDFPLGRITNYYNPDGPRIMLLRDSFSCALAPFLALACSELYTVDLRYFNDEFLQYVNWLKPDLVFVLYSPGSARLDTTFDFFSPGKTGTPTGLKTLDRGIVPYLSKNFTPKKDELFVNPLAK